MLPLELLYGSSVGLGDASAPSSDIGVPEEGGLLEQVQVELQLLPTSLGGIVLLLEWKNRKARRSVLVFFSVSNIRNKKIKCNIFLTLRLITK